MRFCSRSLAFLMLKIWRLKHDFNGLDEALDPNRTQCARGQMIQNDCELR
jgi:hypothetical protein